MTRPTRESFEQLVHAHHAAVYRSALRIVGETAAAADVAQEVFVRALRGQLHLDAARSERATLCWLAVRLAHNAVRARRRRRRHEENAMADPIRTDLRDPAATAAAADLREALQRAVAELPDELRVPLELHCRDDLTLAAIGSACSLSTSTVHDRVQRGLARLREALAHRGFAPAAAALPGLVAGLTPAPVPVGLAARLLAAGRAVPITAASAARRIAVALGLGVTAVGLVFVARAWATVTVGAVPPATANGAAPFAAGPPAAPRAGGEVERVTVAAAAAATGQPASAPGALAGSFVLAGSVVDAAAWPVTDVAVVAVAAGGLKPFELGRTTTDGAGRFRLDVHPAELSPRAIRVVVREQGDDLLITDEIALPRPADAAPLALALPAAAGLATDRFEWRVDVVDGSGNALAGVAVAVHRGPLSAPGRVGGTCEASATTGVDGVATLRGRTLGEKWLLVDGRSLGMAQSFEPCVLERGGQHQRRVVLAAGASLTVLVTDLAGRDPEWCSVWLEDERTGLALSPRPGATAEGHRFTGLGDGPFTVRAEAGADLSPAALRGRTAAAGPVTVRLKPRGDVRDVGDHMAELHGTVVDAVTAQPLALGAFAVDVLESRGGESSSPFDRIVPRGPAQRLSDGSERRGFDLVGLEAGRHAVVVDVAGYAPAVHECELRAGELRSDLRIELLRGATVTGRVLDRGSPAVPVRVFVVGVGARADENIAAWREYAAAAGGPGAAPSWLACATWSGEDGSFRLGRVPPGIALRLVALGADGRVAVAPLGSLQPGESLGDRELRMR